VTGFPAAVFATVKFDEPGKCRCCDALPGSMNDGTQTDKEAAGKFVPLH
jgi:hypothetical protein